MAAGNLLTLIDDIATLLDDVAVMTKIATRKTAGVLGDDLALNAEQVTGVRADRELPVVWAVAKGSLVNKAILVPSALAISALTPWLVIPLLMVGGVFLCFEGFEKVAHKLFHKAEEAAHHDAIRQATLDPAADMLALERGKIKGAVRTDFILSAEIIVISLGTIADAPFLTHVLTLTSISLLMTVGVYGLVAGIVRLDDVGVALTQRPSAVAQAIGRGILRAAPLLMKALGIMGTAAMFLVGGGIVVHGIPGLEPTLLAWASTTSWLSGLVSALLNGLVGAIAGGLTLAAVAATKRLKPQTPPKIDA